MIYHELSAFLLAIFCQQLFTCLRLRLCSNPKFPERQQFCQKLELKLFCLFFILWVFACCEISLVLNFEDIQLCILPLQKAGNEFCKKYQILEGFTLVLYSFSSKSPHLVPFEFCRHTLSNEIRSFYLIWRLTDWTSPLEINFFLPSPSFNLRTFNFKHCEWEASCSDLGKTFAVIYRQGRILSPFEIREMPHTHTRSWIPSIGSRVHTNESVTL